MRANLDLQGFMQEVGEHFVAHPPLRPRLHVNEQRLATLVENGILFLPNYIARETVSALREKIAWLPAALKDGRLGDLPEEQKHAFPDWGLFRIYDVVQSYMSNHARHTRSCVELRDTPGDLEALPEHMMPHFDSYYREIKVWLLLIDVGMAQGPMRYYTKTHRPAQWRAVPDYLRYLGGLWREANGVHPYAIPKLQKTSPEWLGVEKVYCTGTAGSVIIADTRGLHRAWPLEPGNIRLDMYSDYRMDQIYEYR